MVLSRIFGGPPYQKMSGDRQITGKGKRTHDGYLRGIRQLAGHCRWSPDAITEAQARRYFLRLKNVRHFAEGSLTGTLSAFRFFFRSASPRDRTTLEQLKAKGPKTLPRVTPSGRCMPSSMPAPCSIALRAPCVAT